MKDPKAHHVDASWALYDRALAVTPMGSQTHSKVPRETLRGVEPCFIDRGAGCRLWDVDGNEYIDFRNALGPITLGYNHPAVKEAVAKQLEKGTVFSYANALEIEVAERLIEVVPCAESVRFLKTGGEAMAAVHRLARAYTRRDRILTCGYHGWVNSMDRPGVPDAMRSVYRALPWGDIAPFEEAIAETPDEIAAISVACDYARMQEGASFLPAIRNLCDRHGALMILDEIVTGFRLAPGGAQDYFGVTPDLAVFAKGMSNGLPLSCYLGQRNVMETVREVVISSTYGGETLSLAAASAVLDVYATEPVIETIWDRGTRLHDGFRGICGDLGIGGDFDGLPPLGVPHIGLAPIAGDLFGRLFAECLKRGVIFYAVCYTNYAHTEADIDDALEAVRDALTTMQADGCFEESA